MTKLIVFDCDGTLVDSQSSIIDAMQAAFLSENMDAPARNDIRRIVGLPLEVGCAILAGGQDIDDQAVRLADGYRHAFRDLRTRDQIDDPLYPGVAETLSHLAQDGWLMGVATGKGKRGLDLTLATHGLEDLFVTLQTADDNPGKPAPGMLNKAMAEAGVGADQTLMVGDTTFDMEMSRNAGTLAIGVAWGYHETSELVAAGAARIVDQFCHLVPSINELTETAR